MIDQILVAALLAGGQVRDEPRQAEPKSAPRPATSLCQRALAGPLTAAVSEFCLAEQDLRAGESAAKGDRARASRFRSAADHLRRGALETSEGELKAAAVDALARVFDAGHLNEPAGEESALRELIGLRPNDLEPLFRLADLQEKQGRIDLAEDTLVGARRRLPDTVEPYHRLAQFYARRAGALQTAEKRALEAASAPDPGKPDGQGVYRVGGAVATPRREGTPHYPTDAQGTGVEGVVGVEIVVGTDGTVTDARVVRSIPLLDSAALDAVKKWRYEPTLVNGQPVPVRMMTTINFTLQR